MKLKLIPTLIMLSRYAVYVLIIHSLFFSLVLANTGTAQKSSSVREVQFSLSAGEYSVKEVFQLIEKKSNFRFAFDKNDLRSELSQKIDLSGKEEAVSDILIQISRTSGVRFRQINDNITVSKHKDSNSEEINVLITEDIDISGKVTDESGDGLPGATILEKGTANGTTTDIEGNYRLNTSEDAIIIISFVGYETQEVPVNNQSSINIQLTPDSEQLEEVVVIGYGTQRKSDLTGSVATVDGGAIAERNPIQVSQALQGTIPGVLVTRGAGSAPGSSATIRVRGITTIGSSEPLIIVDGVPVDNIDFVNSDDIENISVLKDAASASIYGSRAAAGVILVTTKRAKKGQASFEYTVQYGIEKPTQLPDYVGPERYMEMINEQLWNDNGNPSGGETPVYAQDFIDDYVENNRTNPDEFPITNWTDLILNDHSTRVAHQLNFTVGNEKLRTKGSFKYESSDALWNKKKFERYTARINNDLDINKYLSTQFDVTFRHTINERPNINPIVRTHTAGPIYAAMWSDGRVASGKQGDNAWAAIEYGGFDNQWDNQLLGKFALNFMPFEGLKISAVVSPNIAFTKTKVFEKAIPTYTAQDPTVFDTYIGGFNTTSLFEGNGEIFRITNQFLINYDKNFGQHNLNLLAGFESFSSSTENMGASRVNYELSEYPYLNLGPLDGRDNYGSAFENAYNSYFGRLIYDYKNKYLLQANIRYDGSSRFASDYRWGAFPSVSAGWVLSEEAFMEGVSWLSFLKLRGSWGQLGNERIGNYPYQSTIAFNQNLFYMGNNITSATTAAQVAYAIRDISWETTKTVDLGVDADFFGGRLTFTGDYYQKTTSDMLLDIEIPDYIGYENPQQNTGIMETKGWELQVGWRDKIGEVTYSVAANLSDYVSTMGDLGGTQFLGNKIKQEGSEFDEWYGYLSDGIYQTQDEVDNSATLNASVSPGDIKYRDISGPEGEPDGLISPEYDRTLLGGSLPQYYYGGNINLNYKNINLSVSFQGVGKQNAYLSPDMIRPLLNGAQNVPALVDGNYWSMYNAVEQNTSVQYPRLSQVSNSSNYVLSDLWLFNGAYFRMKNITLSYSLPVGLIEKLKLQGVSIHGTATDLFSINKYPKGWDPEAAATIYPVTTTLMLGLSVKF